MSTEDRDEVYMRLALEEARESVRAGDVPVGAVLVGADGAVLGRGRNRREIDRDPTAHAEIVAMRAAAGALGAWQLTSATMYVTLEPCVMCAGALVNGRVARLVYGCADPKAGAITTLYRIGADPRLNHRFEARGGVLADACADELRRFFAALRAAGEK